MILTIRREPFRQHVKLQRALRIRSSVRKLCGKFVRKIARKPRLQLPLHWSFRGRAFTLTPGRYSWQVRPAVGFGRSLRFGKPIIQSSWLFRSSSR